MLSVLQHSPKSRRQVRALSKHQVLECAWLRCLQPTACCFGGRALPCSPPPLRSLAAAVPAAEGAGFLFSWGLDAQYRLGRQSGAEADTATPQVTLPQLAVSISTWQPTAPLSPA